ncbi:hypothetical protein Nepgr_000823 [Nepenthes gracilis]|uniref:ACT domain-containing protein ACR n=1 Tax=Nepenthes gracilis TaxID=150966 RepID=A0AAD3RWH1_NEPGR|nr:hypothetical protein Nepgr_000823 [Nepenthes gracilis]
MRDFDSLPLPFDEEGRKTMVSVENCDEKGYSVGTVECIDRPRLMFDTICTLMDLECHIFHGFMRSSQGSAFQAWKLCAK